MGYDNLSGKGSPLAQSRKTKVKQTGAPKNRLRNPGIRANFLHESTAVIGGGVLAFISIWLEALEDMTDTAFSFTQQIVNFKAQNSRCQQKGNGVGHYDRYVQQIDTIN